VNLYGDTVNMIPNVFKVLQNIHCKISRCKICRWRWQDL